MKKFYTVFIVIALIFFATFMIMFNKKKLDNNSALIKSTINQGSVKNERGKSNEQRIEKTPSETTSKFDFSNGNNSKLIYTDLQSKLENERKIQRDIFSKLKGVRDQLNKEKLYEISVLANALKEAITLEDWDAFLEVYEQFEQESSETLDLALYQAVINNSPYRIIELLVSRGAKFIPETIFFLASNNHLNLTYDLMNLGLEIHFIDAYGQNAITHLIIGNGNFKYLEFLLMNNLDVKPPGHGRDPLDHALAKVLHDVKYIAYIDKLIQYGAPIEQSHKSLIEEIRLNKPDVYFKLIDTVPLLKDLLKHTVY